MPAIPEHPPISSYFVQRSTAATTEGAVYLWRVIGKSADDVELTCEGLTMSRVKVGYDVLAEEFAAILIPRTAIADAIAADPTLAQIHTGAPNGHAARLEAALAADEDLRRRLAEMTHARDALASRAAHQETELTRLGDERAEMMRERDGLYRERDEVAVERDQAIIDRKAAVEAHDKMKAALTEARTTIDGLREQAAHESALEQATRARLLLLRRLVHKFAGGQDSRQTSRNLHRYLHAANDSIDCVRADLQSLPEDSDCPDCEL
jgi:hypothetical protein